MIFISYSLRLIYINTTTHNGLQEWIFKLGTCLFSKNYFVFKVNVCVSVSLCVCVYVRAYMCMHMFAPKNNSHEVNLHIGIVRQYTIDLTIFIKILMCVSG